MELAFIVNSDLWQFFGQNDLALCIRKRETDWYATLYHGSDGSAGIKDGYFMGCKSCVGEGATPIDAFNDMVRLFSGKTLRFEHWKEHFDGRDKEYAPIEIQFPIVLGV